MWLHYSENYLSHGFPKEKLGAQINGFYEPTYSLILLLFKHTLIIASHFEIPTLYLDPR